jgi:hypothetical protein
MAENVERAPKGEQGEKKNHRRIYVTMRIKQIAEEMKSLRFKRAAIPSAKSAVDKDMAKANFRQRVFTKERERLKALTEERDGLLKEQPEKQREGRGKNKRKVDDE